MSAGRLDVTTTELAFTAGLLATSSSVDVLINGHRVWSVDLTLRDDPDLAVLEWPQPVLPHLDGVARVELLDSATGEVLASGSARLGTRSAPIEILDAGGRHLSVNKWGRLGKTFEGSDAGFHGRLLDRLDELVTFCQERDMRPFVVGGTLLGAIREGKILGHDDDADLAYLSRHTHPSDLSLESFAIERELVALGIDVIRHSTAHLQLTFRKEDGTVDGYVDLFTAFFRPDGTINQPFHVRGEFDVASMLPFSTVELEGRTYPAPASPEDWLVLNYDENWRTPIPGYRLRTPHATRRRFMSWFGRSNLLRDHFEDSYTALRDLGEVGEVELRGAERLHALIPAGARVLDLGSGAGHATRRLAALGHEAVGVDYSPAALQLAAALTPAVAGDESGPAPEFRYVNLIEPRQTAPLLQELATAPYHVLAQHVLERMGHRGRDNVWRLLRQVVRRGGRVLAIVDTLPDPEFDRSDPTTWHLEATLIKTELAALGLAMTDQRILEETPRDRERRPLEFAIALIDPVEGTPPC